MEIAHQLGGHNGADCLIALPNTGSPVTASVRWPVWRLDSEQLVEFGDSIRVLPMATQRLNFMIEHPISAGLRRFTRN